MHLLLTCRSFPSEEQSRVLHAGGKVNGSIFPLSGGESGSHPVDNRQPSLSPEQKDQFTIWRVPVGYSGGTSVLRPYPAHALNICATSSPSPIEHVLPQDIIQQIVSDCSLCASLSVYIQRCRRFQCEVLPDPKATCWMN